MTVPASARAAHSADTAKKRVRRTLGRKRSRQGHETPPAEQRYLLWVVVLGLAFGSYFMLRYQGYWAEIDTSVFLTATERYMNLRQLSYDGAYLHGYAYQVWLATLSDFTGLPVPDLVQLYLPMVSTLLVAVLGFAAYRRLLGTPRLGLMAVGAIFLVPEFLFTISRGNHEKIDISMMLLAILALVNTMREWAGRRRWGNFVAWTLTYHLAAFTLATSNTFFGSTFAAASTLFVLGMLIIARFRRQRGAGGQAATLTADSGVNPHLTSTELMEPAPVQPSPIQASPVQANPAQPSPARSAVSARVDEHARLARRLLMGVGITWCLVMLVMWHLYPAASNQLQTYKDVISRLSSLFLSFDTQSNPYTAVRLEWASRLAYTVVSSFRWLMFIVSFGVWAALLYRAVRHFGRTSPQRLYLIGLYGAFGVLLALSIPVDFLGLAEGNNLQVRLYTYFVLLAAPLFSLGLALALRAARRWNLPRWVGPLLRLALVGFAFLSVLKATVDPTISNLWTFYSPQEVRAVRFWANRNEYSTLWMGTRARLDYAFASRYGTFRPNGNFLVTGSADSRTLMAVDSPIIRAQAAAERFELPVLFLTGNRVYDNGGAELVWRLPQGPFRQ